MSLNLIDTGCVGDQSVRNSWIWSLVVNPRRHRCDELYCATHSQLTTDSVLHESFSSTLWAIPKLLIFSQFPQLYYLQTDREEKQQFPIVTCKVDH
jgi:hypothetical protein